MMLAVMPKLTSITGGIGSRPAMQRGGRSHNIAGILLLKVLIKEVLTVAYLTVVENVECIKLQSANDPR